MKTRRRTRDITEDEIGSSLLWDPSPQSVLLLLNGQYQCLLLIIFDLSKNSILQPLVCSAVIYFFKALLIRCSGIRLAHLKIIPQFVAPFDFATVYLLFLWTRTSSNFCCYTFPNHTEFRFILYSVHNLSLTMKTKVEAQNQISPYTFMHGYSSG